MTGSVCGFQKGSSITEVIATLAVIAVLSIFALIGIRALLFRNHVNHVTNQIFVERLAMTTGNYLQRQQTGATFTSKAKKRNRD